MNVSTQRGEYLQRWFRNKQRGSGETITVPTAVQNAAKMGLELRKKGFSGGTETGWDRARGLSTGLVDPQSLADMRTWFARHGPDASNGGTSYTGYVKWMREGGRTTDTPKDSIRGAVAWLLWGGDPAYLWLKSPEVRRLLARTFPQRKEASAEIRLVL